MAKAPKETHKEKDVDYTIPGLLAIVAVVLFTGLFFRGIPSSDINSGNLAGGAIETTVDVDAPDECEATSYCDGTRLIRRHSDCNEYIAYCQFGCEQLATGAQCR